MAKVTLSALEPERSGRIGNIIFARNQYGIYARAYKQPSDPNTLEQQKVRTRMSILTRLWSKLEFWQVAEWNEAVRWHEIRNKERTGYLSGYVFFIKTNMNLMKIGCKPIATCPIVLNEPLILTSVEVLVIRKPNCEDILLKYAPCLNSSNVMVVSATAPVRSLMMPANNKFKQIGLIDKSRNPGTKPSSILDMYKTKFKTRIGEHERAGFKFQIYEKRTGQAGSAIWKMG